MRPVGTLTTATLVAATVFASLATAATAQATTKDDVAVNGTYRATSIGDTPRPTIRTTARRRSPAHGPSVRHASPFRNATARSRATRDGARPHT